MKQTVDHRELNIQNAMSRCVHFRGMGEHTTCAVGIEYRTVTERHDPIPYKNRFGREYTSTSSMPCWAPGSSGNCSGVGCSKRETITREAAEAQQVRREQEIAEMGIARRAIVAHATEYRVSRGHLTCTRCKTGTLGYTRASNGHVWARCSTPDCLAWME